MVFELKAISYCQVAGNRSDEDHVGKCVLAEHMDRAVSERFSNYFFRCYDGGEKQLAEIEMVGSAGEFVHKRLEKIRRLPALGDQSKRIELTQEIAAALSKRMGAAPKSLPGALFIIHTSLEGVDYVTLVKIDLAPRDVMALEASETSTSDEEFMYRVFDKALPDVKGEKLRKMFLYPSPGDGDGRSGQWDGTADYWELFVGGQAVRDSRRTTEILMEAALALNPHLTAPELAKMMADLQVMSPPTIPSAAEVIQRHTKRSGRAGNVARQIQDRLREARLEEAKLDRLAPIESFQYEFDKPGLKWNIPAQLIVNEEVQISQDGDTVVIRVKQSRFRVKAKTGRPE